MVLLWRYIAHRPRLRHVIRTELDKSHISRPHKREDLFKPMLFPIAPEASGTQGLVVDCGAFACKDPRLNYIVRIVMLDRSRSAIKQIAIEPFSPSRLRALAFEICLDNRISQKEYPGRCGWLLRHFLDCKLQDACFCPGVARTSCPRRHDSNLDAVAIHLHGEVNRSCRFCLKCKPHFWHPIDQKLEFLIFLRALQAEGNAIFH